MRKPSTLFTFEKFFFVALAIAILAYLVYSKFAIHDAPYDRPAHTKPVVDKNEMLRDSIVNFSIDYLGTPYVVAGSSEAGFDCSGFVYFVFKHFKVEVPRSSADFEHFGKHISIDDIQKGDLLLF